MNQGVIIRGYRVSDLQGLKDILSDYPSPTGRVWSEEDVEEMISDAFKEQPDGVFVAKIAEKVVGFAIVFHREWLNIAHLDYIQVKAE